LTFIKSFVYLYKNKCMELFLCPECNKEFESYSSFRKHNSRIHGIKSEDTYIKYKCNGIIPTCDCGCGIFFIH
jgi:uncharacterized C2H2 Zn-finger protein